MFLAGMVPTADDFHSEGTYTPTMTATGTDPVAGADGFLNGKWYRVGNQVTVIIDINLEGVGVNLGGTSYRVSLPFAADMNFHVDDVLDAESDIIGSFQTRSGTASQSHSGSVLLATTSELPDPACIFYFQGSNSSLGNADFTTEARLKVKVTYLADPTDL